MKKIFSNAITVGLTVILCNQRKEAHHALSRWVNLKSFYFVPVLGVIALSSCSVIKPKQEVSSFAFTVSNQIKDSTISKTSFEEYDIIVKVFKQPDTAKNIITMTKKIKGNNVFDWKNRNKILRQEKYKILRGENAVNLLDSILEPNIGDYSNRIVTHAKYYENGKLTATITENQ